MPFCPYCGERLLEDYVFCRRCGKEIGEPAAEAVVALPIPAPVEPTPKPARVTAPKVGRRILVSTLVIVVIVAFIGFAASVKCVPVVRSYKENEEYKYSYKYWELEWKPTYDVVFEKRGVYLGALSAYTTTWYQKFPSFYLGKHWELSVEVTSDSTLAGAFLYQADGTRMIAGMSGTFVTPASGDYYVSFSNFGSSGANVSIKIAVTAKLDAVAKTGSGTATFEVTKYEVVYITIIEWLVKKSQP